MSPIERIKTLFAFPLAFLLGVLVMSLLQGLQISAGATILILVVGLPLLLLLDRWAGRAGNAAIVRGFARLTANPKETRARIDSAEEEEEDAKTPFPTRLVQISGFATGVVFFLIWSPSEIIDWVGGRPFF